MDISFPTSSEDSHSCRPPKPLPLERSDALTYASSSIRPRPAGLQKNWVLLRKLHYAACVDRQKGYSSPSLLESQVERDGLKELQQAARQGEIQKLRTASSGSAEISYSSKFSGYDHYADPLSPLRERDFMALSSLFQRSDIFEIEADIDCCLLQLLPEPCWEEDPFDSIRDFL